MPSSLLSRRAFLAATGGVVGATALSKLGGASLLESVGHQGNKALSPLVLSSDLYASPDPQRLAFAIARGSRFASGAPARVALAPPGADDGLVYDTSLHRDGLPKGRGVYVAEATLDVPGVWNALALTRGKRVPFAIDVKEQPEAPAVGAPAPRAPSATKADPLGVKPICTRRPQCPLHTVSLADVIGAGKPVAVMFATPALCQSMYCGPVLDELLDVRGPYEDAIELVHVEIYESNKGADLAPTVAAWGLPSEPWFYTIDAAGTIVGRLDGAFGGDEVEGSLQALAGG